MLPIFKNAKTSGSRLAISHFEGVDRRKSSGNNTFRDSNNVTTDEYPYITVRDGRGAYAEHIMGMTNIGGKVWYVNESGKLITPNGTAAQGLQLKGRVSGLYHYKLVNFGAYILIFPDGVWYNTSNGTFGNITLPDITFDKYKLFYLDVDDNIYSGIITGTAPASPKIGDIWFDNSSSPIVLKKCTAVNPDIWTAVVPQAVRIGIFVLNCDALSQFKAGDYVTLSGFTDDSSISQFTDDKTPLNGEHMIASSGVHNGWNYIAIDFDTVITLANGLTTREQITITAGTENNPYIPAFVQGGDDPLACNLLFESGNRLWYPAYYKTDDGYVNEIRASALGDFSRFYRYEGISTDSWIASIGEPGEWTGAVNYKGYPMFFKENMIYRISGDYPPYSITKVNALGVQRHCENTIQEIDGVLYYLSREGVVRYSGGLPQIISEPLGNDFDTPITMFAYAGNYNGNYILSANGKLYVYNTRNGLWSIENFYPYLMGDQDFITAYFVKYPEMLCDNRGYIVKSATPLSESNIQWFFETGDILKESTNSTNKITDAKYVTSIQLRASVPYDASLTIKSMYNDSGDWNTERTIAGTGESVKLMSFKPKRCDSLALRIEGVNKVHIYSITITSSEGSDT